MNCKKIVHGGDLEKAAVRFGRLAQDMIDFSANINYMGPPPGVREAVLNSISRVDSYPEIDSASLNKAIGAFYGIDPRELLCGNGASELIYALTQALSPQAILIPSPTFSEYEGATLGIGVQAEFMYFAEGDDFYPDIAAIIARLPQDGLLFLCNPNNPTGILTAKKDLVTIIEGAAAKKTCVVLDESFMDFVQGEEEWSLLQEENMHSNLIIIRSLTKFFALPGLRLGFLRAPSSLKEKVALSLPPWNVNVFAQEAGKALFQADTISKRRDILCLEKEYIFEEMKKIEGLHPYPPGANYIFCRVLKGPKNPELQEILGKMGVYIRDCSSFRGLDGRYFRVAVKSRRDNDVLLEFLRKIFLRY